MVDGPETQRTINLLKAESFFLAPAPPVDLAEQINPLSASLMIKMKITHFSWQAFQQQPLCSQQLGEA
jgi:hypothetical protein